MNEKQSWGRFGNTAVFFILVGLLSLLSIGCLQVDAAERPILDAERPLYSQVVCGSDGQTGEACYLRVGLGAFTRSAQVTLTAEATAGVRFGDEGGLYRLSNGARRLETAVIPIPLQETREITIPIFPDGATGLSGSHTIRVTATGPGTESGAYASHTPVYLYAGTSGERQLYTTGAELERRFGTFANGSGALAYSIQMQPDGISGILYVRITSAQAGFQPELHLSVVDGIGFDQNGIAIPTGPGSAAVSPGALAAGEYRIVAFPFHYVAGSFGGQRTISARLTANGSAWQETAPVALRISDGRPSGHPSIVVVSIAPLAVSDNSVSDGGGRGGGSSDPPPATPDSGAQIITWDRVVSDFYGNRWDAYISYVSNQTPLDWQEFQNQVLLYNPHLAQTGYIFQAGTSYVLPRVQN